MIEDLARKIAASHTPGPWRVEADPELAGRHRYHDTRLVMAAEKVICRMTDLQEQRANALLVAAAPSLLAAVRAMVNVSRDIVGAYSDVLGTDSEPGWIEDLREATEEPELDPFGPTLCHVLLGALPRGESMSRDGVLNSDVRGRDRDAL